MSDGEAKGEVFWMAFRAMDKESREAFLMYLCQDEETRLDLMDLAAIESRRQEKSRPFSEYLTSYRKRQTSRF